MVYKKIRSSLALVLCLALCAVLLCACGGETAEADVPTQGSSEVTVRPLPQENRPGESINLGGVCLSSASDGYYTCARFLMYYDGKTGKATALCAQPGCSHQDSSCKAWVGKEVASYAEYHGDIYAIIREENELRFIHKTLSDGNVQVLGAWQDTSEKFHDASLSLISDNMALISLCTTKMENGNFGNPSYSYQLFDLASGEQRRIFEDENVLGMDVLAFSSKYMIVKCPARGPALLGREAFQRVYGENAIYSRYSAHESAYELRAYDMQTWEYTVIASKQRDGLVQTVDPCTSYGKEVVYQCGDTMYVVNADTAQARAIFTMEGIVNYWIMDNRIFVITQNLPYYIVSDPDMIVSLYCADIDGGEPVKLGNGGNTQSMEFSISQEGASFFIGNWNDGKYRISKDDFYADRYENAKQIG